MKIINRTSFPYDTIEKMITAAVYAYHAVFSPPSCDVEIIACKDEADFRSLAEQYTGEEETFRDCNGYFLCPKGKGGTLRILVIVKDTEGAEQYFSELENGSLRDAGLPRQEIEKRGIRLARFCHFAELVQHEYSHLCSFENLMEATAWKDPEIGIHSMDYHLYDEVIARYRGTCAMLKMIEDYAETDLLYTLWMSYWEDTVKSFREEKEKMQDFILRQQAGIETTILAQMEAMGMTAGETAAELELELGHGLRFGGETSKRGVPKLSPEEVVEFLMVDDVEGADLIFRRAIPLLYFARNSCATYQGAQLTGLVHAFYDFLGNAAPREYNLSDLMAVPYYETADVDGIRKELDALPDLFVKRAG